MRLAFRISLLAIGLASSLGVGAVSAGSLVQFPNLPGHRLANLSGYLAQPDGHGRYPAVVVLPGCTGISGHSASIADRLGIWGYVALAIDSLTPRGFVNHCDSEFPEQAFDAYAALQYLSTLESVDSTWVAVLGQSLGGDAALYAVERDLTAQYFVERFRAAIAYYPGCGIAAASMTAPTLILIGEADDWMPAERCREMVARAAPNGAPIALTVYPGAHHSFDIPQLKPGLRYRGHWVEYDERAAKDAEQKTRAFLDAHLTETSHGGPTAK